MPRRCPHVQSRHACSVVPLVCLWSRSPLQRCQSRNKDYGTGERHGERCVWLVFVVWWWEEAGRGKKCKMDRANSNDLYSMMVRIASALLFLHGNCLALHCLALDDDHEHCRSPTFIENIYFPLLSRFRMTETTKIRCYCWYLNPRPRRVGLNPFRPQCVLVLHPLSVALMAVFLCSRGANRSHQ